MMFSKLSCFLTRVAVICLLLPGLSWAQSIELEVDPNDEGGLFVGGCFDVAVNFTGGGTATSSSYRIQYDPAVVSIEAAEASACSSTPGISHSITCLDGTTGAAAGKRTVSVIYGSTTPVSNIPTHVLGPLEFCVDENLTGSFPVTTDFEFVQVAGSIPTSTDDTATITEAPAPAISVDPTSGSFTAENGSTDTETFTVTNSGNAAGLTVSAATITGANFNVTSNNCPTSGGLAVAATCSIVVEFAPNAVTSFTASLAIVSSAGTENITLTGAGTTGPAGDITITPASTFDFGELLTGEEDATQVFTVTNTGAAGSTVTISSVALSASGAPFSITANTCAAATTELDKDESCTVTVTFEPTSDGEATRTLTVSGTDANSTSLTDSSAMKGTGITEARPTANPVSGASESEVVGPEGSNDFTVVFGNTGNQSYDLVCSLASGDDTSIWSVANGSETTVAAGASHTVTTTCALPDTETYTATLSCAIGSTQTFTYNYECVGLPPLPVPVDNKWALLLLALMMLMAASFGFRFMARQ